MVHMMGDRSDQVHLHPEDATRLDRIGDLLAKVHELLGGKTPEAKVEPVATIPPPNTMTGD